jgi:hypothetical protein
VAPTWPTLSLMPVAQKYSTRLPAALAKAVEARAEALNISTSDVLREGCVRAVCAPVDRRSVAFVALWIQAQDQDQEATAEEP